MLNDDHIHYYREREAAARKLAAVAPNHGIRKIHTELAESYARIVETVSAPRPKM